MQHIAAKKQVLLIVVAFLITITAYFWFIHTPLFQIFTTWSRQNLALFVFVLLTIKIVGIVWPPIPGGIFTLGSIPIIGWTNAYIIDFIGSIVGASIAFYIGKKYGLKFLHKIFDPETINKIKKIKIIKNKQIEAIFVLRILTGSTISEAVSYGAGLVDVSYKSFLVGSVLAHLIVGLPSYYFIQNILGGKNIVLNIVLVLIAIPLIVKLKNRYIE